jgi:hypothetical protein
MSAPTDAGWAAKTRQQLFVGLARNQLDEINQLSAGDWFPSAELLASERARRAEKPWLYPGAIAGEQEFSTSEQRRMVGVTHAIKLGVAIGQARRRDDLANVQALAQANVEQGFFDASVRQAISDAAKVKEKNLAWWRGYWEKIGGHKNRIFGCADFERRPRLRHRRKMALAGPLPPALGQDFTEAQCAVLKVIADEVWRRGTCRLTRKEISDRAQASETVVYQATRKAVRHGLLGVKLRPQPGRKNLPNLLTVINTEWLKWIYSPKYRAMSEDREIEAEARCKLQQQQGAQRRQPYTDTYIKNAAGTWNSQEVADQKPTMVNSMEETRDQDDAPEYLNVWRQC